MTAAENVCYTLINVTSDSEPPSEVSLKTDLGKSLLLFFSDLWQFTSNTFFSWNVWQCTFQNTFLFVIATFQKHSVFTLSLLSVKVSIVYFFTEKGEIKAKTEALKKVIIMILNGEKLPGLLMTIIRFVLPLQDHTIKKLLLVFWEIVPKTTPDGKLLQEMILVCDAYRKVS